MRSNHRTFKANSMHFTNENVKVSIISLILAEGQIFSVLPAPSRDLDDIESDTY
jgi:hypothetical protein